MQEIIESDKIEVQAEPREVEPAREELVEEEPVVVEEVTKQESAPMEEKAPERVIAGPEGPRNLNVLELTLESVYLAWEAPESDGGSPVTSYIIVMREADKSKFKKVGQVDAMTLTCSTDKVKQGNEYTFRVYAENTMGMSQEFAELATPVKIPKKKKTKIGVKSEVTSEEVVNEEDSLQMTMTQKTEKRVEVSEEMTVTATMKTEQEAAGAAAAAKPEEEPTESQGDEPMESPVEAVDDAPTGVHEEVQV